MPPGRVLGAYLAEARSECLRYLRAPAGTTQIRQRGASPLKSFAYGVALTLTNPLTILFWVGVLGSMMSTRTFDQARNVVYFAAGCVTATLLFLTGIALAGHLLERLLNPRLAVWLNRAVGLFLIGFAIKLGADLLRGG